ncbi:MAG: aspartate aminotransferase [Planctomycetes bacterium RIFCSPHIGHO2_12_FULL_52_36]|nr:MAG: aspartate aminotransferase [Planctomycetes bacterium RIFCSPHIGHO2_02_FULL_52_58]OHB94380.1 MAG: aspartate aminotransferase [Planctomycetes bacterium RIFCSPHIGHO2_12_FULL_52_36]
MLSRLIEELQDSGTIQVSTRVKQMAQKGIKVLGFGMGEPDFDTPPHIKQAAIRAIEEGFTKYTPTAGTPELREAICEKLWRDNHLKYSPLQIIVSAGAKQAIQNIILALCEKGQEVIIPSPYWVSYPEQVRLAGATPVLVPTNDVTGFKLTPDELDKAITPRSRLLILNSPCNPTGAVYTETEFRELVDLAVRKGLFIISDEVYEKITYYGMRHHSPAALAEEYYPKVITVNGFSKSYAMTGWRLGYAAGLEIIIRGAIKVQDHTTSCPNSVAQMAGLEALRGNQGSIDQMLKEYDSRRLYIVDRLSRIPGITCQLPGGAFYVFPRVSGLYSRKIAGKEVKNSFELVDLLIEEAGVAFVPGACFGDDNHVRISFATDMATIEEGMDRLEKFLAKGL